MKLKRIEIRVPLQYNPNCIRVQFYVHDTYKVLLTLEQTDKEEDEVFVSWRELLKLNGGKENETFFAYVMGITEDDEIFIFEPYQELLVITEGVAFKFKNVKRIADVQDSRVSADR